MNGDEEKDAAPVLRPGSPEAIRALEEGIEAWRAANPEKLRSADEIDAEIEAERAAWGEP